MAERDITHDTAVFWMNIHLELLAIDQLALRRMRTLALSTAVEHHCEDDVQILEAESDRVLGQLAQWEGRVDRLKGFNVLRVAEAGVQVERRRDGSKSIQEPVRSGSRTGPRPKLLITT